MAGASFASFGVLPIIIGAVPALDRFAANQARKYNHTGKQMAGGLNAWRSAGYPIQYQMLALVAS